MGKPKKQTREERLRKKRLAEKKRYAKIKNDENLWKEKQEKDKMRYQKRKEEKKQLSISEMTPRQQRIQRKRWRKNFNAYYLRKKQERRTAQLLIDSTPPDSPNVRNLEDEIINHAEINNPQSPSILNQEIEFIIENPNIRISQNIEPQQSTSGLSSPSGSLLRRYRYRKDKEISKLKLQISKLKKINERYRKKIERSLETTEKRLSNITKTKKVHVKRSRNNDIAKGIAKNINEDIIKFLEEDRHSRICAGKKECIVKNKVKKQKRYLTDKLINIHQKYLKEKGIKISYAAFCKLRPFWILLPDINTRETCLCKLHTNVELILQALKQNRIISRMINNSRDLLKYVCCDPYNVACLHRKCSACLHKVVPYLEFDNSYDIYYWQWVSKVNEDRQKKIRVTEKIKIRKSPKEVIEQFHDLLYDFYIHCGNISGQYQAIKYLKTNLPEGHVIVHMDFSENYSVKCNEEIQSYHFGGSRKQITLHTAVIYFKDPDTGQLKNQSLCTVSDCLRHDSSAVWAHVVPILNYISEEICPYLQCIHFISDSPSSQYRNKKIFHVISSLRQYQTTLRTITWNYSESGHGKGAPDGVGAAIKQAADRAVSNGTDIKDFEDFMTVVSQNIRSIIIRTVTEYDVYEKDLLFPQKINNFPGCMKMHQIIWTFDSNDLAARTLSCFENPCFEEPILCPHGKHLGFYTVASNSNVQVRSLSESTKDLSMLRKIDWINNNTDNIQQQPQLTTPINNNRKIKILSNVLVQPGCSKEKKDNKENKVTIQNKKNKTKDELKTAENKKMLMFSNEPTQPSCSNILKPRKIKVKTEKIENEEQIKQKEEMKKEIKQREENTTNNLKNETEHEWQSSNSIPDDLLDFWNFDDDSFDCI